jgi:hypothetical protein
MPSAALDHPGLVVCGPSPVFHRDPRSAVAIRMLVAARGEWHSRNGRRLRVSPREGRDPGAPTRPLPDGPSVAPWPDRRSPPSMSHGQRLQIGPRRRPWTSRGCPCPPPHLPVPRLFAALVDVRKPLDGAEFQGAPDRTISRLTLARQKVALRRHLGTEN